MDCHSSYGFWFILLWIVVHSMLGGRLDGSFTAKLSSFSTCWRLVFELWNQSGDA